MESVTDERGEKGEKLVKRCDAICNKINEEGVNLDRMAVFSDVKDGQGAVYYCGLGNEDCPVAYLCQKLNETIQQLERHSHPYQEPPTFIG